ncbi:MAG: DUF3987 domain-containing protein [Clostridia bacterium]|nr:DUF3987 domain-containing protein [Clostridia bacterium]
MPRELVGIASLLAQKDRPAEPEPELRIAPWPDPPKPQAFFGLAGDFIRKLEPHTEADPVGILVQFLAAYGNAVGRGAFCTVEADKHYPNLFIALVGVTSGGRKGTAWGHCRRFFRTVAPDWEQRIMTGLSSGEGLIWQVRDQEDDDEGVADRRLLAYQPELASVLKVMEREGNTLSPTLRAAWDGEPLRIMTKNSPAKATDAHISLIGHISKHELVRYLKTTEAASGFGNRFLWVCVKRSKVLPDGGNIQAVDFGPELRRLAEAIEFGKTAGELQRDEEAREVWHHVYEALTREKPGFLGAMIARAAPQVVRLSLIYALLDLSPAIRREHLEAALALWDFCEASARFIFDESLGDPNADKLWEALRKKPEGMTKTEIRDLFQRNLSAKEMSRVAGMLVDFGLAEWRESPSTGGRPAQKLVARLLSPFVVDPP